MDTVYLDTETTGLYPEHGARIVEIAILDDDGRPLLDTLVDPPFSSIRYIAPSEFMLRVPPVQTRIQNRRSDH